MPRRVGMLCLLLAVTGGWLFAQDGSGLQVDRAVVAVAVESREPVGEASSFPADVERVFLFTHIVGAQGETAVYHVWRHGPTERAKVRLSVRSNSWRTWSSKRIAPGWTGAWTVDVEDGQGNVLESISFVIEEGGD
jgi:hypothetical protein